MDTCFSASAALAGLIEAKKMGLIPAEETILVTLTGRDRVRETVADYSIVPPGTESGTTMVAG